MFQGQPSSRKNINKVVKTAEKRGTMERQTSKYKLKLTPAARAEAVIAGEGYRFTVLTDRLIRLEYQQDSLFVDEPTQRVVCRDFPVCNYRVIDSDGSLEIITEYLHLYYDKKPFSREGLMIQLKESFHVFGSIWNYGDEIHDLRGTARTLDNADGAVELESGLLSREGFTVLDDGSSALMTEDQWIAPREKTAVDLYFFGYGHDYLSCLKDFYRLCGEVPLLPRFTMGNWWSRFYRYTEKSYIELMEKFQDRGIPFSTAVIDVDWHLIDIPKKYGSGWTGYTWNPELFPDPRRFLEKLHEMGMHVTLNVHPADGVRAHEEAYLPMAKELGVDWSQEDKIPFDATDRRFMEAYFQYLHHPNEDRGVDFWWIDWQQGDKSRIAGIDTLWLLNHLHFLDSGRDGKRPLTFSRYAGIGSHRYPVGFSGDTFSTWESLEFQPYFTANASNAGYTWWSHDIGGHQGGKRDDELAVRWLQYGTFSPILRLHSTSNEFYGKEPWNYNMQAEKVMTSFLQLRHRLIPYLYSMNYRTHLEGIPLIRPMYYCADEDAAYKVPNQYWFGTEMIVSPITKPMDKGVLVAGVDVWLPEGIYYDFFTGQRYNGGRRMTMYRSLESIPVLVPAGGIIPMAEDYQTCHLHNPQKLEVYIYNGADGSFDLYEDDCKERMDSEPVITHFDFRTGKILELSICTEGRTEGVIPPEREYLIHMRGIGEVTRVELSGDSSGETTWSYDREKSEMYIRFYGKGARQHILRIQAESMQSEGWRRERAVHELLRRAQIEYDVKSAVFDEICRQQSDARLLGKLNGMNLGEVMADAIMEQIIAES